MKAGCKCKIEVHESLFWAAFSVKASHGGYEIVNPKWNLESWEGGVHSKKLTIFRRVLYACINRVYVQYNANVETIKVCNIPWGLKFIKHEAYVSNLLKFPLRFCVFKTNITCIKFRIFLVFNFKESHDIYLHYNASKIFILKLMTSVNKVKNNNKKNQTKI